MLKERMTIRIFDPLGEHHHDKLKRVGEIDADTDKMDLKKDYKTPAPLGQDLFRECGQLTDYQWTLLSGVVRQRLQECHRVSSYLNELNLENEVLNSIYPNSTENQLHITGLKPNTKYTL